MEGDRGFFFNVKCKVCYRVISVVEENKIWKGIGRGVCVYVILNMVGRE